MSYPDFLEYGRTRLPEIDFRITTGEISNLKLRSRFIIFGFTEGGIPQICKTTFEFDIEFSEDFMAIGEGAFLAEAALFQREQHSGRSLMRTAYSIYEAKTMAEKVPSVGEDTSMDVLYDNHKMASLTDKAFSYFLKRFREIGPKKAMGNFEHQDGFLADTRLTLR
jgi:hypothetical protein